MSKTLMTCGDCDELFADWLEDELGAEARASFDSHVASCARCQGLVRDIAGIQNAAASPPDMSPSRDLWKGVEARIQPSVVAIGSRRESAGLSRFALAAAAAALVVVSSSVTYVATTRGVRPVKPAANPVTTASPVRVAGVVASAELQEAPVAPPQVEPAVERALPVPVRPAPARVRSVSQAAPLSPSEVAVAGEIRRLQLLLTERRGQLEPATVKIIEDNLAIIDAALNQARAALSRDPGSGFLNERFENTLQKKVQLLRTVAHLPSST